MRKLVVFDLDGTLAESKSAVEPGMADLLGRLLDVAKVAVISGGDWPQFEKQILSKLPLGDRFANLSLLPTCGTKFYRYDGNWQKMYSEDFTAAEKARIVDALGKALAASGFHPDKVWGDVVEDRGSQITYSALGQQAPLEAKRTWDPDFAKRKRMKAFLDTAIPGFSVRLGGATSIDVTKPGIDKAYGIRKLRDILGISIAEMIYVGDALFPGGNDHPALEAGVACIQVSGPADTKMVVETMLVCLSDDGRTDG